MASYIQGTVKFFILLRHFKTTILNSIWNNGNHHERTNLDSILKSRHYFVYKGPYKKAMVFPAVRYARERWTIKKAEHLRTDAFQLGCGRRLLRASWTARRSNESILKEITLNIHWKDWCWSWCSSTLATWWEEPTHWKRLMLGRIEGRRRRG